MKGACPIRAPRSRDREREEYRGQRAGDAQFQGNRQWVSGQLTPAANRAAAAAGMSSSAKTRCRSGSTAQVNGLTRVMTASQSRTDQTHLRAVWPSVTLPRRRTERRLGERLSTQRYASLATWQSRLRAQRMVGRPEYLYIAVARDGRPLLPRTVRRVGREVAVSRPGDTARSRPATDDSVRQAVRMGALVFSIALSDAGDQGERSPSRRYLKSALGCLRCSFTHLLAGSWTRYLKWWCLRRTGKRCHPRDLRLSSCRCAFEF
jgi:hypothetical protein